MSDMPHTLNAAAQPGGFTRREFVAVSVAAGLAASAEEAVAADQPLVETDVSIKTPDVMCDAAFIHPASGSHAAVLI